MVAVVCGGCGIVGVVVVVVVVVGGGGGAFGGDAVVFVCGVGALISVLAFFLKKLNNYTSNFSKVTFWAS